MKLPVTFGLSVIFAVAIAITAATPLLAHGGGCRNSSPPGMCCHAGSEPYHCH